MTNSATSGRKVAHVPAGFDVAKGRKGSDMASAAVIEEWRVIPSFPDYAASSGGEIVRVVPDARNHRLTYRALKATPNERGYLSLSLSRDGRIANVRVNRAVCEAFHGPAPSPAHHAAHLDGDSGNNREANLAWKLPAANEADKRIHGTARIGEQHWSKTMPERRARGVKHGRAKLNPEAVRAIRADRRFQRDIAADYGVSQRAVWMVKSGKTWGHVE